MLKIKDSTIISFGRDLGEGAYGKIKEVKTTLSYKPLVSKIIAKRVKDTVDLENVLELRGPNIIKIYRFLNAKYDNEDYSMVLMEKAQLKDTFRLQDYFFNHNLLKLTYNPFIQVVSDDFLRFYSQQLVSGLATLESYSYIHLDIKPENILVDTNLKLKLCDFSLLTDTKGKKDIKIPGGTQHYIGPEYYTDNLLKIEHAKKQDYFGLGATLYYLKFGENLLDYKKSKKKDIVANEIIEQIKSKIIYIKSRKELDIDFIKFICGLIDGDYQRRSNFEKIYRDKWVNDDKQHINHIASNNEGDEEKLIMELEKSDYLKNVIKTPKRKKILFRRNNYNIR